MSTPETTSIPTQNQVLHWRQQVRPYAAVWESLTTHARNTGLVHGQLATTLLAQAAHGRYASSPADAADLLRDMVHHGALIPAKLDLAGTDYSVRALRCLDISYHRHRGASNDGSSWVPTDAHMWTYVVPAPTVEPKTAQETT